LIVPRLIRREGGGPNPGRADLAAMGRLIETFRMDTGRYPTEEEGLEALRVQPDGAEGWRGPYMTRPVPLDPWDRPYVYRTTATPAGPSFVLLSYGKDGTEGGTGEDADVVESGPEIQDSH
jgi:general secretion pathway protein G